MRFPVGGASRQQPGVLDDDLVCVKRAEDLGRRLFGSAGRFGMPGRNRRMKPAEQLIRAVANRA